MITCLDQDFHASVFWATEPRVGGGRVQKTFTIIFLMMGPYFHQPQKKQSRSSSQKSKRMWAICTLWRFWLRNIRSSRDFAPKCKPYPLIWVPKLNNRTLKSTIIRLLLVPLHAVKCSSQREHLRAAPPVRNVIGSAGTFLKTRDRLSFGSDDAVVTTKRDHSHIRIVSFRFDSIRFDFMINVESKI